RLRASLSARERRTRPIPIMAIDAAGSPWFTRVRPLPTRRMAPASARACCEAGEAAPAIAALLRMRRLRTSSSDRPSLPITLPGRTQGAAATLLIAIEIAFLECALPERDRSGQRPHPTPATRVRA